MQTGQGYKFEVWRLCFQNLPLHRSVCDAGAVHLKRLQKVRIRVLRAIGKKPEIKVLVQGLRAPPGALLIAPRTRTLFFGLFFHRPLTRRFVRGGPVVVKGVVSLK